LTQICVEGIRHRIDFKELTGKSVTAYGETEITKDLMDGRSMRGLMSASGTSSGCGSMRKPARPL
jgi:hypothetical protein